MKKLNLNRKAWIVISSIVVSIGLITLLGTSYSLFMNSQTSETANSYTTGSLAIQFDDTSTGLGGAINLASATSMSDEAGLASTPYKLKITNTGNLVYNFDLTLIDDSSYITTHGCSSNQLNHDYIKVSVNGETPFTLSGTNSVILAEQSLEPEENITIELRVWLSSSTPNTEISKHFHGKVSSNGYGEEFSGGSSVTDPPIGGGDYADPPPYPPE